MRDRAVMLINDRLLIASLEFQSGTPILLCKRVYKAGQKKKNQNSPQNSIYCTFLFAARIANKVPSLPRSRPTSKAIIRVKSLSNQYEL